MGNPGVLRPTGRILEDERVFGCMQFGIGATPKEYGSPAHTDGVSLTASVWLDDVQILDAGRYILPELVELCQAMGAPA
jgi:leucyl aminopeptidase (aminopeptidase T)